MTKDEIGSKVRVLLNEGSGEHAQREAASNLAVFVLLQLKRIADGLETLAQARVDAVKPDQG